MNTPATSSLDEDQTSQVINTGLEALLHSIQSTPPKDLDCRDIQAINHVQTLSFPFGILDLRFSPYDPVVFAVATSIGTVQIGYLTSPRQSCYDPFTYTQSGSAISMSGTPIVLSDDPNVCITALAFAPPFLGLPTVAVTMTNGSIVVSNTTQPTTRSTLPAAHALMGDPVEAWVVAWSLKTSETLAFYTGGDDSAFRRQRIKMDLSDGQAFDVAPAVRTFEHDDRLHKSGVTAIVPLWIDNEDREVVLTGSFDEHIRVLYVQPGSKVALLKTETRLDGGVWQLNVLMWPSDPGDSAGFSFPVLASCMHGGCKIVLIRRHADESWDIREFADFKNHESLVYASGFQKGPNSQEIRDMTFVSTSFEDKKLCIWKLDDS
ncbi:MAG: hypothetical protein Q9209_002972 [Squamulea sp. 1 TL-2023]